MASKAFNESQPFEYCQRCHETCVRQTRIKLAAVKKSLYNPHKATYRRAEMDTLLGKLSDEHARTTLPKTVDELSQESSFNYNPPSSYVPKFGMLNLGEPDKKTMERELQRNQILEDAYRKTKGAIPMAKGRLIQIPVVRQFHFLNYHVRFMKPEPRQEWRNYKE